MTINRFQFEPVKQPQRPYSNQPEPGTDPRVSDPFFVHEGYAKVIPMEGDSHYEHLESKRKLTHEQYRSETKLIDRAWDMHYYPNWGDD